MIDRPTPHPTPAAIKLAERYGISPEAMEAIISSTHEEYADAAKEPVVVPPPTGMPVSPLLDVPLSAVPKPPDPPIASQPPPAIRTATRIATPVNPTPPKSSSAGIVTAVFTAIVIAIAIALSFQHGCFRQRHDRSVTTTVDTIQKMLNDQTQKASTPPETPTQTKPSVVPPEALVVPREEPAGTSGKASHSGITSYAQTTKHKRSAPKPVLQTSSNLNAQERLAELRADGNARARIVTIHKKSGDLYQVRTK